SVVKNVARSARCSLISAATRESVAPLDLLRWSATRVEETLTLLSTLPTLWSTLVATSAIPAWRDATSSSLCVLSICTSILLRWSISWCNWPVCCRTCWRKEPTQPSETNSTVPKPPKTHNVCPAVHHPG